MLASLVYLLPEKQVIAQATSSAGIVFTDYSGYPDGDVFNSVSMSGNTFDVTLDTRENIGVAPAQFGYCVEFEIQDNYSYSDIEFNFDLTNGGAIVQLENDNNTGSASIYYHDLAGPGHYDLDPDGFQAFGSVYYYTEGSHSDRAGWHWYPGTYQFCVNVINEPLDQNVSHSIEILGVLPEPEILEFEGTRLAIDEPIDDVHYEHDQIYESGYRTGIWRLGDGEGSGNLGRIFISNTVTATNLIFAWNPLKATAPSTEFIRIIIQAPNSSVITDTYLPINSQYIEVEGVFNPGWYRFRAGSDEVFLTRNFRAYADGNIFEPLSCITIVDYDFTYNYGTETYTGTITPDTIWKMPGRGNDGSIIYPPPPVDYQNSQLVITRALAVNSHIEELFGAGGNYTVTIRARAISTSESISLGLGLVSADSVIADLNEYGFNDLGNIPETSLNWITLDISATGTFSTYSNIALTNTVSQNPQLVIFATPPTGTGILIDYICVDGVFGDTPVECRTIPDPKFLEGTWILSGSASLTDAGLILSAVGSASLEDVEPNVAGTTQLLNMSIVTGSGTLLIDFGIVSHTAEITGSGTYSTLLDFYRSFSQVSILAITGSLTLDYFCLSPYVYLNTNCLAVLPNGTFDTDAYWTFGNGSVWNSVGLNAWIPHTSGGTWQNYGLGFVGRANFEGPLPELLPDEYLILQFDARTPANSAYVSTRLINSALTNTQQLTYSYNVYPSYYTYQADITQFSGDESDIEILFVNDGYLYTNTNGVFVDNICVYISNQGIQLPEPTGGGYTSFGITCNNVSYWLSETLGIDFPALEIIASQPLTSGSIFEGTWVPWIAGKLWVNVAKPIICVMIALHNSGPGIQMLNIAQWLVRQPPLLIAWLNIALSAMFPWFTWFSASVLQFFGWLIQVAPWLFDLLWGLLKWAIGVMQAWLITLLNVIITAWNVLLPSISAVLSEIVDLLVRFWNWLAPVFGGLLDIVLFGKDIVISLFSIFWDFIVIIWQFSANALTWPFNFFNGFMAGINGEALTFLQQCVALSNWCFILVGFSVVDSSVSATVVYPIVIVGILVVTISVTVSEVTTLISLKETAGGNADD